MIMGYCDREGQLFLNDQYKAMNSLWDYKDSPFEKDVAIFLGLDESSSLFKAVMKELEAFYITRGMKNGKVLVCLLRIIIVMYSPDDRGETGDVNVGFAVMWHLQQNKGEKISLPKLF